MRLTLALVKELHGLGRDGQQVSDIFISSEDLNRVSPIFQKWSNITA